MTISQRVAQLKWDLVEEHLDANGYAMLGPVISTSECVMLRSLYDDQQTKFRSRIDMARYNFGRGEYKYFDYPLPDVVSELRQTLYGPLARIANVWAARLGTDRQWPDDLDTFIDACHAVGQTRPTPLMLRYQKNDYNCLHQDLYGEMVFPIQAICMLSKPQRDFDGGELVLVEQRPRMQSRPMVLSLEQGEIGVIPVRERPRKGARGYHRVQMRHGVSVVRRGQRTTLGIIFHDAR